MQKKYIAGYFRISKEDRDQKEAEKESNSIKNQRKMVRYFISHHQELSKYSMEEFIEMKIASLIQLENKKKKGK